MGLGKATPGGEAQTAAATIGISKKAAVSTVRSDIQGDRSKFFL
jgi:hypothetical protein